MSQESTGSRGSPRQACVALKGIGLARGSPQQRPQDLDCLQLVGHFASRRQFLRAVAQPLEEVEDLAVAGRQAEQRLRLEEEHAVVADVVDDGQALLAGRPAQPAAELLVSGISDTRHESRSAAPGWQRARSEDIPHI